MSSRKPSKSRSTTRVDHYTRDIALAVKVDGVGVGVNVLDPAGPNSYDGVAGVVKFKCVEVCW